MPEGVTVGVLEEGCGGYQQEATYYVYDSWGNLFKDGVASYSYDSSNRLVKAEMFSGGSQVNRYDAEGLRHEMEENGKLVQFLYRGRDVVAETAEDGSIIRYIRGKRLISSDNEKARCYYHYASDEMGSITHIIKDAVKRKLAEERSALDRDGTAQDETGQNVSRACVVNSYEYDAFGNTVACEETVPNRFRFAGEQYDQITQQYYLRARFYNPVIGRFLQEDDYYGDGLNLYAYCRNNPVSYIDPSGHGTESAPDKWAENNGKDIQDLVDEMNHGNGASPSDVEAIKSLAEEFGLDPSEFDLKSSQEVNQQALKDLVDEVNQAGGASPSDQKILKEFAEEYGMDYDSLGVKEAGGGTGNTLTDAQKSRLNALDNTINDHLTDDDFSGTLRDLQGNPVPNGKGGYFDHMGEMKDSYTSLKKIRKGLEGSLKNPNLSDIDRAILQEGLDRTNSYITKIEQLFEPYGGI